MISNEHKILACAGQLEPDEHTLQKIRGCMSTVIDADHLIELAVKEGMAGFLYRNLLKAGLLDTLNPALKQRLYTTYYLTIRHNLKLIHALNEILKPLMQKQVQVILMQGISLLQQVYRDIGLRPMNDIDLWVLPNQYTDLVDCLVSLGFEKNVIYADTYRKGEVVLDIHTHILGGDRIQSRDLLIDLNQEEIFQDARPINIENTAALGLNSSDQFLYLSLHAMKHNLERLIWLVDIKSLVAEWDPSDWTALVTRAEQLGQQTTLLYMLYILTNIFKLNLPAEISAYLDAWKPTIFERRTLDRRINGGSIPTWSQLVLISAGKGIRQRLSFVRETLFPRPKILRQVFPSPVNLSDRQLYWKRILQILGSFKG
ncbi:nucleotidyltransferase family protein [bacterium]|nr:nucleotidyltransferase family protein [bacterium]